MSSDTQLTCVEIGGSSVETVRFHADSHIERHDGVLPPDGSPLAIACPGIIEGTRVVGASNLGWYDVDPANQLGLGGPADLVLNDAEAAGLGEAALRDVNDLVFISLGTGIGAAVVIGGQIVAANLLGHVGGFSDKTCNCGRVGCLETVAAGWALPDPLDARAIDAVAVAIATAFDNEPLATPALIVLGGGIVRRYPSIRDRIAICIPEFTVELTAAPKGFKSASAWGLRHAIRRDALRS
jgi:predicted NBD/HSP70 family sugar kinase